MAIVKSYEDGKSMRAIAGDLQVLLTTVHHTIKLYRQIGIIQSEADSGTAEGNNGTGT